MSHTTDAARAALNQRQGAGARFDAVSAPHEDLLLARRGTAFFARKLSELADSDLCEPSAIAGRSRAWVVVNLSYAARREALMVEALAGPRHTAFAPDLALQFSDLDLAETLPPHAIRHLFRHATLHLNVCWRDLSDSEWNLCFEGLNGSITALRSRPRIRAALVWRAALDLGNGAQLRDVPPLLSVEL
jgi:maleylpyruvate isomerase